MSIVDSEIYTVSVVIPTYNEPGIQTVLQSIISTLEKAMVDHEIIVVDDSTDHTPELVKELCLSNIHLIHRTNEQEKGLSSAVIAGMQKAQGTYIVVMDGDGQHPSSVIAHMITRAQQGYDCVMPSRYIGNGSSSGLANSYRKAVSSFFRWLPCVLFPRLRRTTDPLGGLFLVKRERLQLEKFKAIGWKISLEVLLFSEFHSYAEIPYEFGHREAGDSKASLSVGLTLFMQLGSLLYRYYFKK